MNLFLLMNLIRPKGKPNQKRTILLIDPKKQDAISTRFPFLNSFILIGTLIGTCYSEFELFAAIKSMKQI